MLWSSLATSGIRCMATWPSPLPAPVDLLDGRTVAYWGESINLRLRIMG